MVAIRVAFWFCVSIIFYVYFGYPLLLGFLALFRKRQAKMDGAYEPSVSLIIAAYNEEKVIAEKIKNSLKLEYPEHKLEIIVFSDASSDRTDEIVKSYAEKGIKLLRIEDRKGKTYCQNEAAEIAQGEILVFSDANSMYKENALRELVKHFANKSVGGVSGELRYQQDKDAVEGERIYWQYEHLVKKLESRVSSALGANGSIYSVRKEEFDPLSSDLLEDFVRPLRIVRKGYRMVYEPEAVNVEDTAQDSMNEFHRRVRIVTQSVYSLLRDRSLFGLLNPFRCGIFSIQIWSHKVLRWLSGLFLLSILSLTIPLVGQSWVYKATMVGQAAFYMFALWGFLSERILKRRAAKLPNLAYYFCLSCYAMLKGAFLGLRGQAMVTWTPNR